MKHKVGDRGLERAALEQQWHNSSLKMTCLDCQARSVVVFAPSAVEAEVLANRFSIKCQAKNQRRSQPLVDFGYAGKDVRFPPQQFAIVRDPSGSPEMQVPRAAVDAALKEIPVIQLVLVPTHANHERTARKARVPCRLAGIGPIGPKSCEHPKPSL
jgi:hypothetical protein